MLKAQPTLQSEKADHLVNQHYHSTKPLTKKELTRIGYHLMMKHVYQLNQHKVITSPGKFEDEMYYLPFYDLYLQGDNTGTTQEDVIYFHLTEDDKKQFPELEDDNYFWFYHSEQGFINSGTSQEEPN